MTNQVEDLVRKGMLDAVIMGVELARAATGAAIGDLVDYYRRTDGHTTRVVAASVATTAAISVATTAAIDDLVADLRRQANQ